MCVTRAIAVVLSCDRFMQSRINVVKAAIASTAPRKSEPIQLTQSCENQIFIRKLPLLDCR
ncbi:MAG: hypothetical protein RMY34_22790 [Aulosira sp. DedQUE10]|nr:hypothetical protein [Aulosira sp. DedQUE10]